MQSFLRLQPYRTSGKDEAEANHLSDFHSLLKSYLSSKARETLAHASWSFWIVISDGLDGAEGQKLFQLLACVLDSTSIPECCDKDMTRYWKARLKPARLKPTGLEPALSHDDALSNIPDVLKKFALPIELEPLRQNEKRATLEPEVASEKCSQAGGNQSSEYLVLSTNEKVSRGRGINGKVIKVRGCCGWRWF